MKSLSFVICLLLTCLMVNSVSVAWASWAPDGVPICTAAGNQAHPGFWFYRPIVSDGAGGAIITWTDSRDSLITGTDIYAQRVDASGNLLWTVDGVAICSASGNQGIPVIVSDGSGGAIITWYDEIGYNIYAQRVDASGSVQWGSNGVLVSDASGSPQYYPNITTDGSGGAIIVWRGSLTSPFDVCAQHVNASGVVQWGAVGVVICTNVNVFAYADICSDGSGGAIITWEHNLSSQFISAQRIDASGTVQWQTNGITICSYLSNSPRIVSDDAGGAIIIWFDYRGAIYGQRVNASGNAQWPTDGVAITSTPNFGWPWLTADGIGGAIVSWTADMGVASKDIYAQRVNALGSLQWAANGVAICTAASDQNRSTITSDNSGGAVIAWEDTRNDSVSGIDIYAQRVDDLGNVQWMADGVVVCTASNDQERPGITTDGLGGAITMWNDKRNGGVSGIDIYAQRTRSTFIPTLTGLGSLVLFLTLVVFAALFIKRRRRAGRVRVYLTKN